MQGEFAENTDVLDGHLRALAQRDVSVCYFSYGGWFYGIAHGMTHKNVDLRIRQYRVADDASASLGNVRGNLSEEVSSQQARLNLQYAPVADLVTKQGMGHRGIHPPLKRAEDFLSTPCNQGRGRPSADEMNGLDFPIVDGRDND